MGGGGGGGGVDTSKAHPSLRSVKNVGFHALLLDKGHGHRVRISISSGSVFRAPTLHIDLRLPLLLLDVSDQDGSSHPVPHGGKVTIEWLVVQQ